MKKFKLVALCGVVSFLGNIEGFGMDAENALKPKIIETNQDGYKTFYSTEKDGNCKTRFAALTNVEFKNINFSNKSSYCFTSTEESLKCSLEKCDGDFSITVGSTDTIHLKIEDSGPYNGRITLDSNVRSLHLTYKGKEPCQELDQNFINFLKYPHIQQVTLEGSYFQNNQNTWQSHKREGLELVFSAN